MTPRDFDALVEARKAAITAVLQTKAAEYSTDVDRLHNFKRSAAFASETPQKMCLHFSIKHLTSIADIVDALPEKVPTAAAVDEKIGDAINYLILLEALIKENIRMTGVKI